MLTWIKNNYKVLFLLSLTVFMFVGCGDDDDNTVTISGKMTFPEQLTESTKEPVANTAVAVTDLSTNQTTSAQATNLIV